MNSESATQNRTERRDPQPRPTIQRPTPITIRSHKPPTQRPTPTPIIIGNHKPTTRPTPRGDSEIE